MPIKSSTTLQQQGGGEVLGSEDDRIPVSVERWMRPVCPLSVVLLYSYIPALSLLSSVRIYCALYLYVELLNLRIYNKR